MAVSIPRAITRLLYEQALAVRTMGEARQRKLLAIAKTAQAELERDLRRLAPGSYSAQQTRVVLLGVRTVVETASARFGRSVGGVVEGTAEAAARIGRDSLIAQVEQWAAMFEGSVRRINPAELASGLLDDGLLEYFRSSQERYGADMLVRMRRVMAQSVLQGETLLQTADRLSRVMDMKPFWAERIIRTESSLAMHRRQLSDIQRHAALYDEEWRKMTTGPMDPRTGEDSIEVEGQIRELDKPFDSPEHGPFMTNPDRPNDRGTVVMLPPGTY